MNDCGFTPIDFLGRTWGNGRVTHIDVLFADIRANHGLVG